VPRNLVAALPLLIVLSAYASDDLWRRRQWLPPLVLAALSLWLTLHVLQNRLLMFGHGLTTNPFLREPLDMPELAAWFPNFMSNAIQDSYGRLLFSLVLFLVFWYMLSLMNRLLIRAVAKS
jgi:hypothetical protein